MKITRIGVDLAKQVIQVHGVDGGGKTVLRRRLTRGQFRRFMVQLEACVVAMEACGSAHYWGRELQGLGHEVRLMAPQFVVAYRKNDKNDGNDAEAICEAAGRPSMRFVAVKTPEQQAVLGLHRARELLLGQRTALVNQVRGLLAEYGIVLARGVQRVRRGLPEVLEEGENALPGMARETFGELYERLLEFDERMRTYDRRILELAREMPGAKRLMQVPGVGPLTATAVLASVADARVFANGRQFAAWLGLVPRQHSSGTRVRHGGITKRGERYLRKLLVHGARAVLSARARPEQANWRWAQAVRARRGFNKATVALAAKHARIVWAMLAHEQDYQPRRLAPSA